MKMKNRDTGYLSFCLRALRLLGWADHFLSALPRILHLWKSRLLFPSFWIFHTNLLSLNVSWKSPQIISPACTVEECSLHCRRMLEESTREQGHSIGTFNQVILAKQDCGDEAEVFFMSINSFVTRNVFYYLLWIDWINVSSNT